MTQGGPKMPPLEEVRRRRAESPGERMHREAHAALYRGIEGRPELEAQVGHILDGNGGDIDPSFLGFLGFYYSLAQVIPRGRVVYDLGCAYACQSWFFRDHAGYVGVDSSVPLADRLVLPGHAHFQADVVGFLEAEKLGGPSFAICNYVPLRSGDLARVKAAFDHLFVFYPDPRDEPGDEPPWLKSEVLP